MIPFVFIAILSLTFSHLLCRFSGPVWFHHFVRGLFPLGSPPGSVQQHPGDPGGRLEVHHTVQATSGVQGPKHRSVAGNPQRGGHFVCCYECECSSVCSSVFIYRISSVLISVFFKTFLNLINATFLNHNSTEHFS